MFDNRKSDSRKYTFHTALKIKDIKNGERVFLEIESNPIILFDIAGQYFAVSDLCTHDNGPLGDGTLEGYKITCPRHGATFDIRTGKVLSLPAIVDIASYPLRIVNDTIEIGIPND